MLAAFVSTSVLGIVMSAERERKKKEEAIAGGSLLQTEKDMEAAVFVCASVRQLNLILFSRRCSTTLADKILPKAWYHCDTSGIERKPRSKYTLPTLFNSVSATKAELTQLQLKLFINCAQHRDSAPRRLARLFFASFLRPTSARRCILRW